MENKLVVSNLGHTWILDLDGTIVKHNGYKIDGEDSFIIGADSFLRSIPKKDMIVFLTSRPEECRELTERFLKENGIRFDHIIFGAPYGERILINDEKPSGLKVSIGINKKRDDNIFPKIFEDGNL